MSDPLFSRSGKTNPLGVKKASEFNARDRTIRSMGISQLARNTDPITSHIAAATVHQFAGSHVEQIVLALYKFGPMTADEIATRTSLDKYQICRRLPEAEKAGMVKATTILRHTKSGRVARVWEAA